MEYLIKIEKDFIDYLRVSYLCPECHKQVILAPDIGDKEYFSCGECQHSIHVRGNQFHYIENMLFEFDRARNILEKNGLQVWIEGQPVPNTYYPGSTSLKRTYRKSSWEK